MARRLSYANVTATLALSRTGAPHRFYLELN